MKKITTISVCAFLISCGGGSEGTSNAKDTANSVELVTSDNSSVAGKNMEEGERAKQETEESIIDNGDGQDQDLKKSLNEDAEKKANSDNEGEKEEQKLTPPTPSEPVIEKLEDPMKEELEKEQTGSKGEVDIHKHGALHNLLSKFVSSSGKVNYKAFKSEKNKLDGYLDLLARNPPTNNWSRNEKLAYWINLYNAATIQLILENYPLKSITDLDKPWDKKFVKSGNRILSLNEIENSIIRPTFKEPRIHFAVNCAAKSCPKLSPEAYTASNLENQLEKNARYFINKSGENELSENKVALSKIFEWYADDFGGKSNLAKYISRYASQVSPNARVEFKEYNWSLNE